MAANSSEPSCNLQVCKISWEVFLKSTESFCSCQSYLQSICTGDHSNFASKEFSFFFKLSEGIKSYWIPLLSLQNCLLSNKFVCNKIYFMTKGGGGGLPICERGGRPIYDHCLTRGRGRGSRTFHFWLTSYMNSPLTVIGVSAKKLQP